MMSNGIKVPVESVVNRR